MFVCSRLRLSNPSIVCVYVCVCVCLSPRVCDCVWKWRLETWGTPHENSKKKKKQTKSPPKNQSYPKFENVLNFNLQLQASHNTLSFVFVFGFFLVLFNTKKTQNEQNFQKGCKTQKQKKNSKFKKRRNWNYKIKNKEKHLLLKIFNDFENTPNDHEHFKICCIFLNLKQATFLKKFQFECALARV